MMKHAHSMLNLKEAGILFFLFLTAFFFRYYKPSMDLPYSVSWSNAITQDATWYTAGAVHRALGLKVELDGKEKILDKPIFRWYCYFFYILFGPSYATNTLLSAFIGLMIMGTLFYLVWQFSPSSNAFRSAIITLLFISFNFVTLVFTRVPVLYLPSALWISLVVLGWLKGLEKPIYFFIAWILLFLGYLGLKVVVLMIGPALFLVHFLLSRDPKYKKSFLLLLLFLFIGFLSLYFTGKLAEGWAKFASKWSQEPKTFWERLMKIISYGNTSRWFLRLPFFSFLTFLALLLSFLDPRPWRKRILELLMILWLATIFVGTMLLDKRPLRFLSPMTIPMAALIGLGFEKWYYFLQPFKKPWRRRHRWRWRKRTLSQRPFSLSQKKEIFLLVWIWFFLLLFIYHMLLESMYFWKFGLIWDMNLPLILVRRDHFLEHFLIAFGLSTMFLGVFLLWRRRLLQLLAQKGIYLAYLLLLGFLFWNMFQIKILFSKTTYTQRNFSRELPSLVGKQAHISGAYAHPLTLENSLNRSALFSLHVADPDFARCQLLLLRLLQKQQNPLHFIHIFNTSYLYKMNPHFTDKLKKRGVTHLALPVQDPDVKSIEKYFQDAKKPLWKIREYALRGFKVHLYRIAWDQKGPLYIFLSFQKGIRKLEETIQKYKKPLPLGFTFSWLNWIAQISNGFLQKWILEFRIHSYYNHLVQNIPPLLIQIQNSLNLSSFEKGLLFLQTGHIAKKTQALAIQVGLPLFMPKETYLRIIRKSGQWFLETLKSFPYSPYTFGCLADCARELDAPKEELKYLKKGLKINPYDSELWIKMQDYYMNLANQRKGEKRIEALTKALNCAEKAMLLYPLGLREKQMFRSIYLKINELKKRKEDRFQ